MSKKKGLIRVIRNILIALVSAGWLIPLQGGIHTLLWWLYNSHQSNYHEQIDCGLGIGFSSGFIGIGLLWLGIVIAFWAFVAAKKLWPVKGENKSPLQNGC